MPAQIAQWSITKLLGRGGNAEVFVATDGEREVALKVLKTRRPESEQYARFRHEIELLQRHGGDEGVLPIIEAHLPEAPTKNDRAWIAMPVAQLMREALADASMDVTGSAIAAVSQTLARLAVHGVAHRDLKPDNLYQHEGKWVVGDFGLVHLPDLAEVRLTGSRLGPYGFMPDEMFNAASAADPHAVDVFQLAVKLPRARPGS